MRHPLAVWAARSKRMMEAVKKGPAPKKVRDEYRKGVESRRFAILRLQRLFFSAEEAIRFLEEK